MVAESAPVPSQQSVFGERYVLSLSNRLREFDTAGGEAYLAADSQNPDTPLYAFVHDPSVPIRNEVYNKLKGGRISNVVCPVDRGMMNLDLDMKVQRLVTIFERPTGGVVFDGGGRHERISTGFLRQNLTLSMVKALAGLHKKGIIHRNIRPYKMFFLSKESDEIFLGECCTTPAGYRQHDALDPLEVVFADNISRGEATIAADFFQFGASLLGLYLNDPIWKNKARDTFLIARINQSSFWALASGQDVPGALGLLIKGLLADEVEDRWVTEDVLNWFEGSSTNKRIGMANWSMSRPTNFKGTSYVDRRLLAHALASDPKAAAVFIRSIDFPAWVHMSLRDEVASERIEKLLNIGASETGMGHEANFRLVTRFCMFLHPSGPIRYKEVSVFPDSISASIAEAFSGEDRDKIRIFSELLNGRFLTSLVDIISERSPEEAKALNKYREFDSIASSKNISSGMERVLYDLNPLLPCQSSKFDRSWIGSLKQMLQALDRIAAKGSVKNILLDRHVSAFISSHGKDLDRDFNKIIAAKNDMPRFNALTTDLFGLLQKRLKMNPLVNLTGKLVDGMGASVKSLKNKKRRESVNLLLEKVKKTGDISKLTSVVNMPKIQAQDMREFTRARYLIQKMDKERTRLMQPVKPDDIEALSKGYNGSRTFSGLSLVTTIIMFII